MTIEPAPKNFEKVLLDRPCPFCGGSDQQFHATQLDEKSGYNFRQRILCKCGASLGENSTQDKAGWCTDRAAQCWQRLKQKWGRRVMDV